MIGSFCKRRYPGAKVAASAMQLLMRLLDYDPTPRITAEEALSDSFFKEVHLLGMQHFQQKFMSP